MKILHPTKVSTKLNGICKVLFVKKSGEEREMTFVVDPVQTSAASCGVQPYVVVDELLEDGSTQKRHVNLETISLLESGGELYIISGNS